MLFNKLVFVVIGLVAIAAATVILIKIVFGSGYEEMGDNGYII